MNRIILLSDVPSAEVTSDWEDISYLSDDVFIRRHADEIDCIAPEDMEEECRKINAFLSQRLGMDARKKASSPGQAPGFPPIATQGIVMTMSRQDISTII